MNDLVGGMMADVAAMKAIAKGMKRKAYMVAKTAAEYEDAKNRRSRELSEQGMSAAMIKLVINGDQAVAPYYRAMNDARADYDTDQEELNAVKLSARLMNDQIDREWRG